MTDLDTHRSHDSDGQKLSASKWFAQYIAALQNAGHQTATSFAVYQAGQAAGYVRSTLAQAASLYPDVRVISRSGGTTWSICPQAVVDYRPAREWLDALVAESPDSRLDPDEVRSAGELAGYTWTTIRYAVGIHPRIESVPARGNARNERIWLIVPDKSEDSA